MMKKCPAPTARAFFAAMAFRPSSFPSTRTRHGPEASQNATPNLIPGTEFTRASWTSSAVLMKWVWPRMTFSASGFSIGTSEMSKGIVNVSPATDKNLVASRGAYATCTRKPDSLRPRSTGHDADARPVVHPDDDRRSRRSRGAVPRRDGDPGPLYGADRPGAEYRGIHGDPVPLVGLPHPAAARGPRRARSPAVQPRSGGPLDEGVRDCGPSACAGRAGVRARRVTRPRGPGGWSTSSRVRETSRRGWAGSRA